MSYDSEENELSRNIKISPTLVIIYTLLGLGAIIMSGLIFYYIYQIFK